MAKWQSTISRSGIPSEAFEVHSAPSGPSPTNGIVEVHKPPGEASASSSRRLVEGGGRPEGGASIHAAISRTVGPAFAAGDCAIDWKPDVLHPVFSAHRDYPPRTAPRGTLPARVRMFFPTISLGFEPGPAHILDCQGQFPLVYFFHGQCDISEPDHYLKWYRLGSVLARSGYIVAMPEVGHDMPPWEGFGASGLSHPDMANAEEILYWIRTRWEFRDFVWDPGSTVFAGHSFGALLAGRWATRLLCPAYISFSGAWRDWMSHEAPSPLANIICPKMFQWGDQLLDFEGDFTAQWPLTSPPKHSVVYEGMGHFDYVKDRSLCVEGRSGECNLVESLAADFAALFLGRILYPGYPGPPTVPIPASLIPPTVDLSLLQKALASGHLSSFDAIAGDADCSLDVTWDTPGDSGTRSMP